ncbi:MAG: protein kinase [Verrucomicrobia bacterium]|nr:protein kinase [Verrucomicrobiota bacterium]
MATEDKCPHCGKPVPTTALGGICPECMLKAGVAADTAEVGPDGTVIVKPPLSAPPVEEITPHFPQLEIIECLGRGGMGVVYKARQPKLDRFVALKILTRHRDGGITDSEFAARFEQEARALARLNHPDIVAVYDFGEAGGFHYLLMEYVDGLTLRQLLQTRKLSPEEALAIVPKICEALQFAHERGIVHRDIKPENILLDKQGRVKIADFGIAKIIGTGAAGHALTGAKDRLGTPHYMAPEQVEKPATVDHRADIYSLGVVFYEMLTGELPLGKFQSPSRMVQVDVRLDEVVLHALEKNPDRRYQHASEVKTDLETIASSPAPERATNSSGAGHGDAGRFRTSMLPELLPGERVVHFKRRVWAAFTYSPPSCRLFFSLPPLWEAGLYVTDRRILFVAHALGVFGQEFSIWFNRNLKAGRRELLQTTSTGRSFLLGDYLDIRSEAPQRHWYRGRELLLRIYTRRPDLLGEKILVARSGAVKDKAPAHGESASGERTGWRGPAWVWSILFSLMTATVVLGWFASDKSFSLPACLGAVFIVATVVTLSGRWLLSGVVSMLDKRPGSPPPQSDLPMPIRNSGAWMVVALIATAIMLLMAVSFPVWRPAAKPSLLVNGIVTDAATARPIVGARVSDNRYVTGNGKARQEAWTDANGRYTLHTWPEEHTIAASAPGYETSLATLTVVSRLRGRVASMDFQLTPAGTPHVPPHAVPPVVIATVPESGADKIDPSLTELRVTFSKPMQDDSWSWTIWGEENFPEMTGQPQFLADGRTCVLPVKLKPGKLYAIWLNSDYHQDFKDRAGQSALPYLLIFETRK